ncbi:MAG TPA: hypothetical protein VGI10_24245 [Polyangiaceae bacterium]|jgi:hypothetical protein
MLSERFQIKLFLDPKSHVELEALVPVFHRFIRDKVLPELMIDVVDYSHVHDGPGVVLIGHESDYYVGKLDGVLGLVYSRKRAAPAPDARLKDGLRRLLNVARLLEHASDLKPAAQFRRDELTLRATDRLRAPNSADVAAELGKELQQFLVPFGGATVERIADAKGAVGVRAALKAAPNLEAWLEQLGGPA